ncbi:UDP-glycosyltransferase UGT5-like isoform X4 [Coccinella septempunctata]|uniref:UDP-glycosyltransferase UGT5-like isoform X4 n=1 Tax=Coccinella septempunctata TaxID=41139 RepID=UPI001D08AF93|nr:UDP-glycosyltransferase UGT5-like isoform X4 [Coccinella septempunctata]
MQACYYVIFIIFLIVIITLRDVKSARILGWCSFPSISHQRVFQPLWRELSLRGHEVTAIVPNPLNDPSLTNLTEIDTGYTYDILKRTDITHLRRENMNTFKIQIVLQDLHAEALQMVFEKEEVKVILEKNKNHFDLIIIEGINPILFGLQHKFDAPLVAVSSLSLKTYWHFLYGNSIHPVLFTDYYSELVPKLTFWEKFDNIYITIGTFIINKFVMFPRAHNIAKKYFGEDMPYIEEMVKSSSLMFSNNNPIFSDLRPLVPNVILFRNVAEKGYNDMHEDLKQILDNAKEGVVYFSLGTNVRFDHVQGDVKKTIMEALGDLPYTVICKWESEKLEGQPKNVHLRKWLPQQAILAHPNVKAFVTQGGLQSAEEAIINAVPLVVIPFLGDQPLNAKILTSKGMAETISPKDLNRRILTESIMKVAQDEKYRNKAKELRDIFLDQPQSGIDKVIWWCEYVIRHKGAKHLRSPAADIPLWEYFMLDVLAVVLIALYLVYKITKVTIKILLELFKRSTASTTSKKKKKN